MTQSTTKPWRLFSLVKRSLKTVGDSEPQPTSTAPSAAPRESVFHFEDAEFRYEPYPIGLARPVLPANLYRELLATWPSSELFAYMPKLGKKYSLSEVNNGERYLDFLQRTPVWKSVYDEVKSAPFVRSVLAMLKQAGIDLGIPEDVAVNAAASVGTTATPWADRLRPERVAGLKTRFEFSMLPADGGHIKPHTDAPGKLITLVVSLCDETEWRDSFGGELAVLRAIDPRDSYNHLNRQLEFSQTEVVSTFPFQPNQCVIFVKTFNSLHTVYPMRGQGSAAMRKTLTINIQLA